MLIYDDYLRTYEIRKLDNNEIIKSFDCGDTDLNDIY